MHSIQWCNHLTLSNQTLWRHQPTQKLSSRSNELTICLYIVPSKKIIGHYSRMSNLIDVSICLNVASDIVIVVVSWSPCCHPLSISRSLSFLAVFLLYYRNVNEETIVGGQGHIWWMRLYHSAVPQLYTQTQANAQITEQSVYIDYTL